MWILNRCFIILFALAILSGCQKEENAMNTLRLNFQEGDLPSLHPHPLMIYLRGISISKSLYECLTRIDSNGNVQMAAAQSVDISPNKKHYLFKLRETFWSDGSPVTAMQFEAAWKEALSPHSNVSRADLLYMIKNAKEAKQGLVSVDAVGIKAIDAHTLEVELAYPSPFFLELTAQPITAPLIDPKVKEPTIFNGPFLVEEWKRNDVLKLKKNPRYWDQQAITLDRMEISMIQDAMAAFALFEKNQLDWIGVPLTPLNPEMINKLKHEGKLSSHPVDRAFWVFLNVKNPALLSSSIRQALAFSIDREAITQHILVGGHPLKKAIPSALLPIASPLPLDYHVEKAVAKLEEGLTSLNLTRESLPPIVINYSQQAGRKQLAEYLQQAWSRTLGIQVKAEPQEWNVLRSNLEKGEFQVSGCFEAAFYKDPLELMEKFTSINPNNFSQWIDSEFIEKITLAKREADPARRIELLGEAEKVMLEQMPLIPICSDEFMFATNRGLKGVAFDSVGACDYSRVAIGN